MVSINRVDGFERSFDASILLYLIEYSLYSAQNRLQLQ